MLSAAPPAMARDVRRAPPPPLSADAAACVDAIAVSEASHKLAPNLLHAIGMVESGRMDPVSGRPAPWPWTINVAGVSYFFDTKLAAITAVQAAQAAGVRSIDVGCLQINLAYHPTAFASLDEAFDPRANAQYAGLFLHQLWASLGSWPAAAAAYHSMTPDLATAYAARVAVHWPAATAFAASTVAPAAPDPLRQLDPDHVMTPEFRARVANDAATRTARYAAMGLLPVAASHPAPPRGRRAPPRQLQASLRPPTSSAWR